MEFYNVCSDIVTKENDCPFLLENFDSKEKEKYILIRTDTRELKENEREKLNNYKICSKVGYVHVYKAYDVDSAKKYLIDDGNNDPLTRKKPSDDILKKIQWKYNNKNYIKQNYTKDELFNIFGIYYSKLDFLPFDYKIKSIILNYVLSKNDVNVMKCNLYPNDFNCFVDCKREETNDLLHNYSWLLRPSSVDSFDFYYNNDEILPCSKYYVLSLKKNTITHYLIEHSFGEGYYFCTAKFDKNRIPTVKRLKWFGSFVYTLEHLLIHNYLFILDYYKN